MAFTPTTWVEDSAPAITAAQLNRIETGIDEAHDDIATNLTAVALNTTHRSSDGSDHSWLDQDVTSGADVALGKITCTTGSTKGLWFGDGDTGVYEESDDLLYIKIANAVRYHLDRYGIRGGRTNSFEVSNDDAGIDTPAFVPNQQYPGTGVSARSGEANTLVLSVNELEVLAAISTGVEVTGNISVTGTVDGVDVAAIGAASHAAVTLHASATTGGLSLSTQEISFRAATNAQTGYATAAHITAVEANTAHLTATGASHSYIDQDVTATGNPQFTTIELGHASDTTIARSGAGAITVEGNQVYLAGGTDVPVTDGGTGSSTASGALTNLGAKPLSSYSSVWIPAAAMIPATTSGAEASTIEHGTNDQDFDVLSFDTGSDERAMFSLQIPDEWDRGNIEVKFYWDGAATASGTCEWAIKGVAISNDDPLDVAQGTAYSISDTLVAVGDLHITGAVTVTVGGSPALADLINFEVFRDVSEDSIAVDTHLLGVSIQYQRTTNPAVW